jgi:hypothetical protein
MRPKSVRAVASMRPKVHPCWSRPCDQRASVRLRPCDQKCIHAGHVHATKNVFLPGYLRTVKSYPYLVTSLPLNRVYPCAANRVSIFNQREQGVKIPESALLWTLCLRYVHKNRPPSLIISSKDSVTSSFIVENVVVAVLPCLRLSSGSSFAKEADVVANENLTIELVR